MTRRFAALALALAATVGLRAHELELQTELVAGVVVVRARYDGGDPAANADVWIYRPGAAEKLFQQGRSALNGAFAFVPDEAGAWRVTVDDGFGHRLERIVETGAAAPTASPSRAAGGRWRDALSGVSILIGLTGFWLWRRSRA